MRALLQGPLRLAGDPAVVTAVLVARRVAAPG